MRDQGDAIDAGIQLIDLEQACGATFRDELCNFFPDNERAHRLAVQVRLLPEFPAGVALVHGLCHQKAIVGMECTESTLRGTGLDTTMLDSGCFSMAGALAFDRAKYEMSMRIGEDSLLPVVRSAAGLDPARHRRVQLPGAGQPSLRPVAAAQRRSPA